jgi:2-deoxy-D-gluconate 3-dehydrogenase
MGNSTGRRVALVTGASYGVGAATALRLAADGFDLALSATRRDNLGETLTKLEPRGVRGLPIVLDLCSQASIEDAIKQTLAELGRLDLLVNNAGANLRKLALDVTPAEWDAVMTTNITGTFFLTQQFGRHLIGAREGGAVVSVASTQAFVGAAERSTYGISKAALVQMTRMLAVEWAEHGIRVNAVAPGRLDTASPSRAASAAYMQAMLARIPLHRLTTAEEVAEAVAYLASPAAASITGHTLMLDGGLTAV